MEAQLADMIAAAAAGAVAQRRVAAAEGMAEELVSQVQQQAQDSAHLQVCWFGQQCTRISILSEVYALQ